MNAMGDEISQEEYVRHVLDAYRKTPGTMGAVRRADRTLAAQLYQRGLSVRVIENGLVLAATRRLMRPAYISYISPLIITTSAGKSATYTVTVSGVLPGLLAPSSFQIGGRQYAVALFSDNQTYVLPVGAIPGVPSRPAKAGDAITLYGIGFGAVSPSIPAGQVVQGANSLLLPLSLKIGGAAATLTYAGLGPGLVGLYQFNAIVPKLSVTGADSLTFSLEGVAGSQTLYLSTQ
jgi:uncharacterized protein (TIGR03437 family)